MKKVNIFFLLMVAALWSCGQNVRVPQAAKDAFASKFPSAKNIKWGKENAKEFEAEFTLDGVAVSANFDNNGQWLETETTMPFADLPVPVKESVQGKYPDATISLSEKIEHPDKVMYEVHLKAKGKKLELVMNPDGSKAG